MRPTRADIQGQRQAPQALTRWSPMGVLVFGRTATGRIRLKAAPGVLIPTAPRQVNVTLKTSKEEMASAACELIDSQAEQLADLQQRQTVLLALVGLLTVLVIL